MTFFRTKNKCFESSWKIVSFFCCTSCHAPTCPHEPRKGVLAGHWPCHGLAATALWKLSPVDSSVHEAHLISSWCVAPIGCLCTFMIVFWRRLICDAYVGLGRFGFFNTAAKTRDYPGFAVISTLYPPPSQLPTCLLTLKELGTRQSHINVNHAINL